MNNFSNLRNEFLSYLLTLYPAYSQAKFLEDMVKDFLSKTYNLELIDKFWIENGHILQSEIIEETNRRIRERASLRFEIMDDIGEKIAGCNTIKHFDPRIAFQDALHELTPLEFESLAAALLRIAGCSSIWKTPKSHDQGLDAFGYACFFPSNTKIEWLGGNPEIVFLAQAKHYKKDKVSAPEIREFVGAASLAKHDIYAVQGDKYSQLSVRKFSPLALIYMTSGEIKITAKILAQKTGMLLIASDEMFVLFKEYWSQINIKVPFTKAGFLSRLRKDIKDIPTAR